MTDAFATTPDPESSRVAVDGPHGRVEIARSAYGIPSVEAPSRTSAWWGMGYAAAQDRLWQLEFDRRRATGTWAEAVGEKGLPADRLARRLRLEDAARADVSAMDPATLGDFIAYAEGVTAGAAARALPDEFAACGIDFAPWEAWHSVAAFKIRHVLMGAWQYKMLRTRILVEEGPDAFEALDPVPREGLRLTTPSGRRSAEDVVADSDLWRAGWGDIAAAADELGFLSEVEAGSNAWAVAPSRTTTGHALLCNDPHRAADVPNVYWQASVRCPDFHVAGETFPGIPGFPHFGHNGRVGWAITNAAADAQDLVVEELRERDGILEVRTPEGWARADVRDERIRVRGGEDEWIRTVTTTHGPVVHGSATDARVVSLRWTATVEPCAQFAVLDRMARADSVDELLDGQRGWVDPLNNLIAADVDGRIGYLLRGALPDRVDPAGAQLPLPGWERSSRWRGLVPFDRMPRETDPACGWLANANNVIADPGGDLLIAHHANDLFRIERIDEVLEARERHAPADLHALQNDTLSIPGRIWGAFLADLPATGEAERARALLAGWDGELSRPGPQPVLYAHVRRALVRLLLPRVVSGEMAGRLLRMEIPASGMLIKRWYSQLVWSLHRTGELPAPLDADLAREALAAGLADARAACGDDLDAWSWSDLHVLAPKHTLDGFADPRTARVAGDHDTVANAAYPWRTGAPFPVTNLAVSRQVLDVTAGEGGWIVPTGASAESSSPHYDDQAAIWEAGALLAMPMPAVRLG